MNYFVILFYITIMVLMFSYLIRELSLRIDGLEHCLAEKKKHDEVKVIDRTLTVGELFKQHTGCWLTLVQEYLSVNAQSFIIEKENAKIIRLTPKQQSWLASLYEEFLLELDNQKENK